MRFVLGCSLKCAAPGARATRAAADATKPAIRRVHGLGPDQPRSAANAACSTLPGSSPAVNAAAVAGGVRSTAW
jgi:hypothetical protein